MMQKGKSVIQQVIVLLAVFATFCSWPAVSGSLKGAAEKLIDERLQTDSLFKTAESTAPTLKTIKPGSFNADIFSSASVWTPKETWPPRDYAWQGCRDINCILEYMKKSGASDEALYFTRKIVPETLESEGYLETFEEKGRVDLGFVFLPFRANTNGAFVFLNGSPSVVSSEQRGVGQLDISGDSNYSMLKKQYPQLQIWGNGAGFVSEHANTNGGQRFILDYALVNYCHACAVGWKAQIAYDFSKDGIFKGITFLKLVQDQNFSGSNNQDMSVDLVGKIDKALARLPKPSDYLYEMNSVPGQIVGTWTEMTASLLGARDLRVAYDNFYQSSVEYAGMFEINLRRSRKAALNNDAETAKRLLEAALRYERQFYLNDKAAIEAFNGNIDAATELAKGIYEGSKASTIYGSSMVLGPLGSRVVDVVFDATDFAVEASDSGLTSATKKLVAGRLTEMIFSQTTVTALGGMTLKSAINRGVTKTLGNPEVYKIVHEVLTKPEFVKAFMGFMAKSSAHVISGITEDKINKIVMAVMEEIGSKTPSFTECGSMWYQRLGLQFLEVEQATRGSYSFNAACQAHDACYGDCRTAKAECDKKLLADAEAVCGSTQNKANCFADAQIFFQAVSEKGDTSLKEARAKCYKGPLDDTIIKSMIKNRLKDYIPIDLIGNYMSGTNGVVEEIEILEKSYEKEQLNAIGKVFLGEPKNYWGVVVRVKGHGQVGFNNMVAGMMSGDPDSKRSFNSITKYRFYDAGGGSWSLVSPEELRR